MSKAKSAGPTKVCDKSCCTKNDSWVFIIKEFEQENARSAQISLVQLRHPRTNTASLFLFTPGDKIVQEVLEFEDKPRSYFYDNKVKSDGKLFLSTPIDPLYLALPYLKKYGKCSPLDHIITDDEFPETERLLECTNLNKYIHQIADRKGDESLNAFAYNEEKALKWLERKVRRVADSLKEKGIHVASNNVLSATFVTVKDPKEDTDAYLRYALGMVSNYLPESLTSALETHMNLPPLETEKKRKSNSVENGMTPSSKKKKVEEDVNENGTSPAPTKEKEKKATPSAKAKAMAKAASGTKNIMSFFQKK